MCVCVCVCVCVWLFVRSFVRSFFRSWGFLLHGLGARGVILGDWGASQAPFWVLWESLGYLFGCFGGRLGSILGLCGPLGSILEALGDRGCLWGSLGAPLAAQGAQSQIFPIFSLPFWDHFGSILEVKTDPKSDTIFD